MFIGRVALTDRRTHTKQHKPKPVFLVGVHPFLSPKMQINTFSREKNTLDSQSLRAKGEKELN